MRKKFISFLFISLLLLGCKKTSENQINVATPQSDNAALSSLGNSSQSSTSAPYSYIPKRLSEIPAELLDKWLALYDAAGSSAYNYADYTIQNYHDSYSFVSDESGIALLQHTNQVSVETYPVLNVTYDDLIKHYIITVLYDSSDKANIVSDHEKVFYVILYNDDTAVWYDEVSKDADIERIYRYARDKTKNSYIYLDADIDVDLSSGQIGGGTKPIYKYFDGRVFDTTKRFQKDIYDGIYTASLDNQSLTAIDIVLIRSNMDFDTYSSSSSLEVGRAYADKYFAGTPQELNIKLTMLNDNHSLENFGVIVKRNGKIILITDEYLQNRYAIPKGSSIVLKPKTIDRVEEGK